MSGGVELIAAERQRQVEVEGYGPEHDRNQHDELAHAAAAYALPFESRADLTLNRQPLGEWLWPWAADEWKPTPQDRIRELVKAGALIAAAIDALLAKREVAT